MCSGNPGNATAGLGDTHERSANDRPPNVVLKIFGQRGLAERLAISRATLRRLLAGHPVQIAKRRLSELRRRLAEVRLQADNGDTAREATREAIRELIDRIGLHATAQHFSADPSNLLKMARGVRHPTSRIVSQLLGGIDAPEA